jgi:hypothetical protein
VRYILTGVRCRGAIALAAVMMCLFAPAARADATRQERGTEADGVSVSEWSTIQNLNSKLFLAIGGSSQAWGAPAIQWHFTYRLEQQWRTVSIDSTWIKLQVRHSGQCLGIGGGDLTPGAPAVQWPCADGGTESHWYPEKVDDQRPNLVRLRNRHSGQCLGVAAASYNDGARVVQWPCADYAGHEQMWFGPF